MKTAIFKRMVVALSVLICLQGLAQKKPPKPNAFDNYGKELVCFNSALDRIMNSETGALIETDLANNFKITGTVISNVQKYGNLKTVLVRLTNFPNLVLSLSKLSDKNTKEHYAGRIISSDFNDAYEIVLENGAYKMKKKMVEEVIPICQAP